jgi:hypothetical protein
VEEGLGREGVYGVIPEALAAFGVRASQDQAALR